MQTSSRIDISEMDNSSDKSSIESTHDSDEDFEFENDSDDYYETEKKRPKLKNDKRKKEYKQKDLAYLKNRYQSTNIDSISNIDFNESFVSNEEITTSVKHQWYYVLCDNFDKSS